MNDINLPVHLIRQLRAAQSPLASRRTLRRASHLLPLEQRFMFDGAAVATAVHDVAAKPDAHDAPQAAQAAPAAHTVREADASRDDGKKEVVFVDTSLADYKTLEAGVRDGVGIVEFDGTKDGLAQIAQWAATQSNYDAIHILSHGAQGVVELGTTELSESSLSSADIQQELAQLGQALTSDGDLLLYGCDVAAGSSGTALLDGLARATGADVAASINATGAAAKGGDWTLEAQVGKIDTAALDISGYQDLLTQVTITGTDADYTTYQFTKSVDGYIFTFSGGDPVSGNGLGMDSSFGAQGLYAYDGSTASGVKLTITVQSGYTFDLSALDAGLYSGNLTIQYTNASNVTNTLTLNSIGVGGWQTVSGLDTTINDVVKVVISSDNFGDFQNFNFTDIKSIAPAAVVNSALLSSDTGISNSDFITQTASQTITGTLSVALGAGERVEVSYDNGNTWSNATGYAVGSSNWSTTTTLSGSNTFEARVSNADASSTAYTHSYTLDTTASTITFGNIALSADTGTSNSDFITNVANQTITATLSSPLSAGDVVYGSLDGGSSWTDITSKVSGNTLLWTGATLSGSNTLVLKVGDIAGNDGATTSKAYVLDITAPATSVASASFSNDTGTSSSDFITRSASQTISGTLSANLAAGEVVYVSINNGATWTAANAPFGQNSWSLSGVTLSSSSVLSVKVSDAAGNDGPTLSQAYLYDTTAPTTSFGNLAFSSDTGTAGDFITATASQTISATLGASLTAGDILYGSLDGGSTWTDITGKVSGTSLSWNGVTLAGSNTLQLKVVDAAGNEGAVRSQAYVLDTTAPTVSLSSNVSTLKIGESATITLTFSEDPGASFTIGDLVAIGGTVGGLSGSGLTRTVTFTPTAGLDGGSGGVSLAAGSYADIAGNSGLGGTLSTLAFDTAAPDVVSVSVPANGTYYTGDAMDLAVNFSEAVRVDASGGMPRIAIVIGSTTRYADYVSGSGTSTLVFRYTVVNGDMDTNGITVGSLVSNGGVLSDLAGNVGSNTLNGVGSTAAVLVDGSQPNVTSIGASTADGSYAAGSTVTITVDFSGAIDVDTSGGTPTLALSSGGTAVYTGGSGSGTLTFSYTVGAGENSADLDYSSTGALALNGATITSANGSHQNASVILAAPGAAGSLGANKNIVIDTIAPAITGNTVVFSNDSGSSASDLITNSPLQSLSGTLTGNLASGDSVQVSLDNGATWTTATSAGSTWALATPQVLTGSDTLKVRVVDAAGNIGSAASYAYVLDTTAPTTTFGNIALSRDTGASNSDFITNVGTQTISATLSAPMASGDRLFGSLDNGATWTDITGKVSGTTLSWDGVTLGGANTLQLMTVDAAGNDSAVTSRAYTLITVAPTTTVASAAFSNDSGASASDFITSVAAQTVSGTLSANVAAGQIVYVSLDNGATWVAATATVGQATWSLGGQTLTGSSTLLVKVSDVAGNDGPVYAQAYVYEVAPPAATPGGIAPSSGTIVDNTVPPPPVPRPVAWTPPQAAQDLRVDLPQAPVDAMPADMPFLPPRLASVLDRSAIAASIFEPLTASSMPISAADESPGNFTHGGAFRTIVVSSGAVGGEGLVLYRGIGDQTVASSGRTEIVIPQDAFAATDASVSVALAARQADGRPLPNWIRFDNASGKFLVDPPKGVTGDFAIKVVARDSQGHEAATTFRLHLGNKSAGSEGRAGLSEQLHQAARQRSHAGVLERLASMAHDFRWPNA